ncbi:citrate/2-methylcitrate synthase [Sphingomonas sp. 2SG]|uniref:citrate/2-methylcitrate synthase n=1 Tax=Sphingomonas sp. 2SG TaxID=2502201 RepID=UPI0014853814|nr:citrate/2-methylcitrate synthase [Sphingomonas sp. 2SG]
MTEIVNAELSNATYLSAEEAAAALGVTRATLYAYVSRHGIRSCAVAGSKQRLYWKEDILLAKRPRGRPRVQEAEPPRESSISLISDGRLYYRGQDAVALSATATLEEAACLLWDAPRDIFNQRPPELPKVAVQIGKIMEEASAAERAIAMLPMIETANPRAFDLSAAGMMASGVDVLRCVTSIILRTYAPSDEPVHDQIGERYGLSPVWRDLVRRLLVLSADLGFEPVACAVRGVAGVGVSPYRSVLTGLLLLGARRTQLGRLGGISTLLDEIIEQDPQRAVVRRLREGAPIPGFGGGVFPGGDPKAMALLDALSQIDDHQETFAKFQVAIRIVSDALNIHPSSTLVGQYISRCLKHDPRDSLIVLGRCAGWIAHSKEQYLSRESGRPASIYVGSLPITS